MKSCFGGRYVRILFFPQMKLLHKIDGGVLWDFVVILSITVLGNRPFSPFELEEPPRTTTSRQFENKALDSPMRERIRSLCGILYILFFNSHKYYSSNSIIKIGCDENVDNIFSKCNGKNKKTVL